MMLIGTNNNKTTTLTSTVWLLFTTSMLVLLSVMPTMVEAQQQQQLLQQEKQQHGNLRRSLSTTVTSSASHPIEPVKLLTAGKFAILTKTGVTTTSSTRPTRVVGDIGTSPVAASYFTGFGMILDSSGEFSTSPFVNDGEMYAADYTSPTPNMLTVAGLDMQQAYINAAGRSDPDFIELGAGQINGFTLEQGLYKWGTAVSITDSLVFDGPADAVWILQVAGDVTIGTGAMITLSGGAKAENIFWQVGGKTVLGTTSHVEGVFLCKTSIVFQFGSSLNGAALAQTAVTLDTATIVKKSVCDDTVGCQE